MVIYREYWHVSSMCMGSIYINEWMADTHTQGTISMKLFHYTNSKESQYKNSLPLSGSKRNGFQHQSGTVWSQQLSNLQWSPKPWPLVEAPRQIAEGVYPHAATGHQKGSFSVSPATSMTSYQSQWKDVEHQLLIQWLCVKIGYWPQILVNHHFIIFARSRWPSIFGVNLPFKTQSKEGCEKIGLDTWAPPELLYKLLRLFIKVEKGPKTPRGSPRVCERFQDIAITCYDL